MVTARPCNGNCIQDPPSLRNGPPCNSAQNYAYDQQPMPNLLRSLRNGCGPYNFDSNFCRVLDDRVLCGYNKNVGQPKSKNSVVKVDGDCRIRGGRVECGYHRGSYSNPRRPPVEGPQIVYQEPFQGYNTKSESTSQPGFEDFRPAPTGVPTANPYDIVTRCVELEDRIVCRKV